MRRRAKLLPLVLSGSEYSRLEADARASERDPLQQAKWLLRESLERRAAEAPREPAPEASCGR